VPFPPGSGSGTSTAKQALAKTNIKPNESIFLVILCLFVYLFAGFASSWMSFKFSDFL
jgi:hypothetical protein